MRAEFAKGQAIRGAYQSFCRGLAPERERRRMALQEPAHGIEGD